MRAAGEATRNDGPMPRRVPTPETNHEVRNPADASDDGAPRGRWGWRRALAVAGPNAAVAAVASGLFLGAYQPWGWRFRVPWSYGRDNYFYAMLVRTMQQRGGYGYAPELGAPFGQELYDFPQGGTRLHLVAWRIIGLVVDDPFVVLNVYFATSFALVAVVAFAVFKRLGVRPLVAGGLSIVYAFLPFHFSHGLQHPALSAYWSAPMAVLLAWWVAEGAIPLFSGSGWDRRRVGRLVAVGALAALIGSSDPYYSVFAVLLIAVAASLEWLRSHEWRPLLSGAAVAAAVLVVLAVNLLPEALFRIEHGANHRVTKRHAGDSEVYALHLTQVIAPSPSHRVDALADIGRRAVDVPLPGESGTAIGLLGVVGLVTTAGALLAQIPAVGERRRALRRLGALQLCVVLIATVGGGGFALAVVGIGQIRSWGRMVVILAFLALTAVGLLAGAILDRPWFQRGRRTARESVAVLAVAAIGVLDVIPGGASPSFADVRVRHHADRAFVATMEERLPVDSMVFQLPVVPFPETPLEGMGPYDHAVPYIVGSNRLRWSFGGLKGRMSDWQEVWRDEPTDRFVDGLAAAGFAAVYLDTKGYPDNGAKIDAELVANLGPAFGAETKSDLRWYDLRPRAAALRAELGATDYEALGAAVLTLVRMDHVGDIGPHEIIDGGVSRELGASSRILLPNFGAPGREITVRFGVEGPAGATLRALGPGIDETVSFTGRRREVELRLELSQGTNELELSTDGEGVRLYRVSMIDAVVEAVLGRVER